MKDNKTPLNPQQTQTPRQTPTGGSSIGQKPKTTPQTPAGGTNPNQSRGNLGNLGGKQPWDPSKKQQDENRGR